MKRAIVIFSFAVFASITSLGFGENVRGIEVEFVTIGYPNNPADNRRMITDGTSGYGLVSYEYRIGKYEVTNAQWNAFITNAGAPTGAPNSYYDRSAVFTDPQQPANCISWYEALQFCNYLTSGDKSKGAYQFSGTNANPGGFLGIDRESAKSAYDVVYFLPTEDEWYKAAYYKPEGSGYSCQPNGLIDLPAADNGWNYKGGAYNTPWDVGTGTQEQNGTYDMTGNVWEWNEALTSGPLNGLRGFAFSSDGIDYVLNGSAYRLLYYPDNEDGGTGFRVASTIPEPTTPPITDAGSDQTVIDNDDSGGEEVILDGSGSFDSDGTIVSWVWMDDLGDLIPNGEVVTATLSVGTHTITLTVTDDDGLTDSDTVQITVEPYPDQPPAADADGPYTIFVGDALMLDGSSSTDYENNIMSYLWDLDDNGLFETDAGNQPVFEVNYAALQSIGLLVGNMYTIRLKVTDSAGQSDIDDSSLTILPMPALPVFVDIKPGSCPNPFNPKSSGVLPVAIVGTGDYDIATIDPTSIRMAGVEPLRSGYGDVAAPAPDIADCNCIAGGPDGLTDLILKFKMREIAEAIGEVNEGDVLSLQLTGIWVDPIHLERPIEGTDCVLIVGRHKPFNPADINKDGVVDVTDYDIFAENWLQRSVDPSIE